MFNHTAHLLRKKAKAFSLYKKKLGFGGTIAYAARRITTKKGGLIPVRILNWGQLYLRNGFYDTAIFSQIFIYEELNFALLQRPATIIDCGANIGLATLYFKYRYPEATIISVEPEQSNFEMLQKNTKPFKDVHLLRKGIWNKTCNLYLVDLGEGHASFRVTETDPERNVIGRIEAVSIDDVMKSFDFNQVDLLKMDIEGSEYECFKEDNNGWADKASCIAIEIHEHMYPGCKALIDRSLAQRNYQLNGEYHIYTKRSAV